MNKPRVLVLRTAGTNCDIETKFAFELCSARVELLHINKLIDDEVKLDHYQILAIPGGFSYGDDIASGRILANELKYKLGEKIYKFSSSGKPIIGICNGFQVLVKMGILPKLKLVLDEELKKDPSLGFNQSVTLGSNDSDKFESRWVHLQINQKAKAKIQNFWLKGLPDIIPLPVAHGEGKFIAKDSKVLADIENNNQVAFRYADKNGKIARYPLNPNGSANNIAGIFNDKGNILGLMPHPERYIFKWQHPNKTSVQSSEFIVQSNDKNKETDSEYGWGLQILKNAVEFVR
ncbi:MAG: phosphoribosylformylglycinamidine synthase I [Elusimicrobia bacterium]|nr:phosphoribosylformylglycinamidine synthase I [Candidatus Liberimonas magnetica]